MVPWLLKGIVLVARSRRGQELLFAGALAAVELARSEQARKVYGKARSGLTDPRPRAFAADLVRKAKQQVGR